MTSNDIQQMIKRAIQAKDSAYAPYSNHPVGACIMTENGQIFAGANVENAAYPLSRCAESTAIGNMVLGGSDKDDGARIITKIVVVGPGYEACTPCGGCRQSLREFASSEAIVYVCDKDGKVMLETDFSALLPHSFGPDNVKEVNPQ
ncbi:cytidine deaminase [Temperatibacter marinus]|uniref:Cytidine deaminase n=1 Tax=Temperatibacter marinus TaxID=1456591 RepID=A0AA52EF78_9PROT|nr:cytidine deaminase [Temperatibacter marinus]WND01720.1 cytidine deaminase [Temperatibacter marinus]